MQAKNLCCTKTYKLDLNIVEIIVTMKFFFAIIHVIPEANVTVVWALQHRHFLPYFIQYKYRDTSAYIGLYINKSYPNYPRALKVLSKA